MNENLMGREVESERESSISPIRTLDSSDIADLCHVSGTVGWGFTPERMQTFLKAGSFWGHYVHGKVVSSAGVFSYGQELSGIGIVMVKPAYQRRGLGRILMETCLERMESPAAILIATEMGAPLYKQLGFRTINMVQRWVLSKDAVQTNLLRDYAYEGESAYVAGSASAVSEVSVEVPSPDGRESHLTDSEYHFEPLSDYHIERLFSLDEQLTGVNRRRVLNALISNTDAGSGKETVKEKRIEFPSTLSGVVALGGRRESIKGFALVTRNDSQIQIGPVMAPSDDVALHLVRYTVRRFIESGRALRLPFRVDVPYCHIPFTTALEKDGWKLQKTSPLMLYGSWDSSRYKQHTYGLIDPAFG